MRRRVFLTALVGGIAMAGTAQARDPADEIVRELKRNRYRIETVSRTFLGRIRIVASRDGGRREIIVNPATGEILRDLWVARGHGGEDWDDLDDDNDGRSGGRHDDDDDDDDDDHDNDDDDRDDDRDRDGKGGKGGGDDD